MSSMVIRPMQREDVHQVFDLMRDLAVFERYIDRFAHSPETVAAAGFDKQTPDFYALVAADETRVDGVLVYYFLPYTAANRPAIYMKELFIRENARGQGLGKRLMKALKEVAQAKGCSHIQWTVAPWNTPALHFYENLGAVENRDWLHYYWDVES